MNDESFEIWSGGVFCLVCEGWPADGVKLEDRPAYRFRCESCGNEIVVDEWTLINSEENE